MISVLGVSSLRQDIKKKNPNLYDSLFKLLAKTVAEEYKKISKYWNGETNKNCLHVQFSSLLTFVKNVSLDAVIGTVFQDRARM